MLFVVDDGRKHIFINTLRAQPVMGGAAKPTSLAGEHADWASRLSTSLGDDSVWSTPLHPIVAKLASNVPLSLEDGLRLYKHPDLNELGALANHVKQARFENQAFSMLALRRHAMWAHNSSNPMVTWKVDQILHLPDFPRCSRPRVFVKKASTIVDLFPTKRNGKFQVRNAMTQHSLELHQVSVLS